MKPASRRALASGQGVEYVRQLARARAGSPKVAKKVRSDGTDLQPPGGFSYGTSIIGGPLYSDPFGAKRAPTPWQLIENFGGISYAMVSRIADAVAKVPLRLYGDNSRKILGRLRSACDPIVVSRSTATQHARRGFISGGAVDEVFEVRNHPFLDTLDKPDPWGYFSRKKLLWLMAAYQTVVGAGFLVPEGKLWGDWKNPLRKGPPEHLWVIYPQFAIPFRESQSPTIKAWQYFRDYIPFEAAIWFRHSISLRDAYGSTYSPLYAAEMYRSQEAEFISIYNQIYALGPRPNVVASAKDPNMPPGEAERKRLEQDFVRRHAAGNAGGIWVNTGAWEFTPISYSPADMGGKELAEYDRNNMACILGLPPTYFTTDTNLANLEAADAYFARFAVEPMCASIAETLTSIVQAWDKRLYFAFDPVLAEDELKQAQIEDIRLRNGSATINLINQEKKYPNFDWGDEPLIDKGMQPLSVTLQQAQQGLAQQQAAMEQSQAKLDLEAEQARWEMTPEPGEEGEDVTGGEAGDSEDETDTLRAIAPPANPWAADATFLEISRTLMIGHVA